MNIPIVSLSLLDPLYSGFGWIVRTFYNVFGNYGIAVILFTIAVRLVLMPLSVKNHKSSIQQRALAPQLEDLKRYYGKDQEGYAQAQMELNKKNGVSLASGCWTSLLQMFIMWPVFRILQGPLHYVMGVSVENLEVIASRLIQGGVLTEAAAVNVQRNSLGIIEGLRNSPEIFAGVVDDGLMSVSQLIDMDFFGINLGLTPSISPGALFGPEMLTYLLLLIFPILVVLTSFVSMQYSQRMMAGGKSSSDRKAEKEKAKNNPALQETSPDAMANQGKMMMWIMPIMMLMFTLNAPVAMSLYYIISNVLMIFQYWLFNKIYNEPLALRQAESDAEWERTIKARAEKEKAELEKIEESSSKKKRKRKARS